MTDDEFQRVVEECRSPRGALTVLRMAGDFLTSPPAGLARLEKLLQGWSKPVAIEQALRAVMHALEDEGAGDKNARLAGELLRALLVVTCERLRVTC